MKIHFLCLGALVSVTTLLAQSSAPEFCVSTPNATSAPAVISALKWDKTSVELRAGFGQKIIRTAFRLTNAGDKPVSIVDVKPSCACVATQLDKLEFAPGETGELKLTLDLEMEAATSLKQQTIAVTTDDAPNSPANLKVTVHVPEAVQLSSDFVSWDRDENPVTKDVHIEAGEGVGSFELRQPAEASDDFKVVVTPEAVGKKYLVRITPKTTAAPSYAQVMFLVESSDFTRPVDCRINLNVK